MPEITFAELLRVYKNAKFDSFGDGALLTVASQDILDTLIRIDNDAANGDGELFDQAAITCELDPRTVKVGDDIRVRIGLPQTKLGQLVPSMSALLLTPRALTEEPNAYFVKDGGIERNTEPVPPSIRTYRKILEIYRLVAEAASYVDLMKEELVFIDEDKFLMPIRYDGAALDHLKHADADRLLEMFQGDIHREEKLGLLAKAAVTITKPVASKTRFSYLLDNLDAVADEIGKGYKLYISQFSYSKIKSDIEAARLDFITKIHKTIVDIQAQLLGIPIATFIVASQIKEAPDCSLNTWTNIAVLAGAWIFVVLLSIGILNQWMTLLSIRWEIKRQRTKLVTDFEAISSEFIGIFNGLLWRTCVHFLGLIFIGFVGIVGAGLATAAYDHLTGIGALACTVEKSKQPEDKTDKPGAPAASQPSQPAANPKGSS